MEIKNKKVLAVAEQGFGDVLQFVRYLKLLKEYTSEIYLQCNRKLFRILNSIGCVKGFYDFDKPFVILSKKANISAKDSDIVYMKDMKVTLNLGGGRVITITSDEGIYNKVTYDCFFEKNVMATDGETEILSGNLDLIASKDYATIYNDVKLTNDNGSLRADKVEYNFEAKYYKISMFQDEKVKIKLIK